MRKEKKDVEDESKIKKVERKKGMGRIEEGWNGWGCNNKGNVEVKEGKNIDEESNWRVDERKLKRGCRVIEIRRKKEKWLGRRKREGLKSGEERKKKRIKMIIIIIEIRNDKEGRNDIKRRKGLRKRRRKNF